MKIPINLASQPFRRDRAMLVASVAVSLLLVVSLSGLILLANTDNAQLADVRKDVARLRTQIAAASKQQSEFDAVVRKPENAEVLERSVFLNTLLYRKGLSWTRILADLEKTMPPNVKMLNIQPYVTGKNQITIPAELARELDIAPGTRLDWAKGGENTLIVKIIPNRAELARRLAGRGKRHLRQGSDPIRDLVADRVREDLEEDLP